MSEPKLNKHAQTLIDYVKKSDSALFKVNIQQYITLTLLMQSVCDIDQLWKKSSTTNMLKLKLDGSETYVNALANLAHDEDIEIAFTHEDIQILSFLTENLRLNIEYHDHDALMMFLDYFETCNEEGLLTPMFTLFKYLSSQKTFQTPLYNIAKAK